MCDDFGYCSGCGLPEEHCECFEDFNEGDAFIPSGQVDGLFSRALFWTVPSSQPSARASSLPASSSRS
jgi:hypothetical protein